MDNEPDNLDDLEELPYKSIEEIDFNILTMGMKRLPFFEDDLFLGMQAMNVGIVDAVITDREYSLLREWFEIEKTPIDSALEVSALSQMWIYGLYEVLRMWRDRHFQFDKWQQSGGIEQKLDAMSEDDPLNLTLDGRKRQLSRYKNDESYRLRVGETWLKIEPVYRMLELLRINLAKHCAPGKNNIIPRAPGYGRINRWCGAMDYEVISREGFYTTMNRRDIADALRSCTE